MDCLRLSLFTLLVLSTLQLEAARIYVKATGTGSANGTSAANAVGQAGAMAAATAGDELYMCGPGFSSVLITKNNLKLISCDSSGNTNKYSWEVTGSPGEHGVYTGTGVTGTRVWGVRVLSSYIDGVKWNGSDSQIWDSWISNAGRGDPSWVTNSNGSFSGQGIGWHGYNDIVVGRTLIENCGARLNQDHGIYGMGTNTWIISCIIRSNIAYAVQGYDSTGNCDQWHIVGSVMHDNGSPGVSTSGVTIWTQSSPVSTNYLIGCTIIARTGHSAGNFNNANTSSRVIMSNNIIQFDTSYGGITGSGAGGTNSVLSGYNLKTTLAAGEPHGVGDTNGTATYVDESKAKYAPNSSSPARGIAISTAYHTNDFFGRVQSSVTDVGAMQYEASLAADTRNWGDGQRDPWVREPGGLLVSRLGTSHLLSWTEQNEQHVQFEIQRKDSVNNTYALMATVNKGTLTYTDSGTKTNGVTYTYSMSPVTSLGNGGGITTTPAIAQLYNAVNGQIALKAFRY